ncbi:ABC transporter permease [Novosphingobium pentaromativorans]|uniref:Antibiotic transport system permease protein n=1 Tax=Novosphingobium pentaromativorans US6-1 TaxID=1088721 RepID=G6EIX1_9SPHN|nr:ABC transporter permease [Novosphingobium pentaromativorans]AIT78932.1 membrane protein [Novosphingobium pentaromativorans US6-1]EHJ58730.1 antibiotic transport system permease protein [Novosphingobium pentaromativorans US6-1]
MRSQFIVRLTALTRKETRQMLRDRSNLMVGLLLPVALILLFGYGLSFDVRNAPVALVLDDNSAIAREAVSGIEGSRYLAPVRVDTMARAQDMLQSGKVDAIVRVPIDFSRRQAAGRATIQLILNGIDSTTATSLEAYVSASVSNVMLRRMDREGAMSRGGSITLKQRTWFNEASISTWYLVPGLIVLVMTLVGAFLTSLLIAREWERGTLEALFVTPVRPLEIVLSKLLPYMVVGLIDLATCLLAARFLFQVPIRGSLFAIVLASTLYLAVSLLLGLFISGRTRNQFAASQVALLTSFLPALMLSGFIFDLRNVPIAVQVIAQLLPATHFMGMVKSLFLAGTDWMMVARNCTILAGYAVVLIFATRRTLRKTLD